MTSKPATHSPTKLNGIEPKDSLRGLCQILGFERNGPRALALDKLIGSICGVGDLGMLHPRTIQRTGPFSMVMAHRINAIGRFALCLENSDRSKHWSELCRGMTKTIVSPAGTLVGFGISPQTPAIHLSSGQNMILDRPVGSVFARIFADGIKVRALLMKCAGGSIPRQLEYGRLLFETARMLAVPLVCVLLMNRGKLWVVEGHLNNPDFARFLVNWGGVNAGEG